jgi:predicted Zn-dependent peptidase
MALYSVLLTSLALTICAAAQDAPQQASETTTTVLKPIVIGANTFERRLLPNGLHAVAVKDDRSDMSIFIAVAAGTRQETEEITGLAHLTEHALFTGTPTTGTDVHEKTVDGWGGESNAFTRDDYTMYYDHAFPVEHMDLVLSMEADRLSNLSFEEKPVLHERYRLKVEEKHSYRTADGRSEQLENAFFEQHPYRHGLRSEEGHTKGPELSVEQIKGFYNTHYQADRFAVVVVGPMEPTVALDAIEKAFGGLEGNAGVATVPAEMPTTKMRVKKIPSQLPRDRFVSCWLSPALGHKDHAAMAVLSAMLGREQLPSGEVLTVGMGGRVDSDIFQVGWSGSEEVTGEVALLLMSYRDGSVFEDKGKAAILAEVKGLMVASHVNAPLRARPYFSLAGTLAWYEVFGLGEALEGWGQAVEAVTQADLQRVASTWLELKRNTLIIFEGTGEAVAALPSDVDGLYEAASQASETGDYDRAIQAFTLMLATKPNRMNTVIYYYERGSLHLEMNDFDSAIGDFEAALLVVDYPAVRDALEEAHARKKRAMRGEFESAESQEM